MERNHQRNPHGYYCHSQLLRPVLNLKLLRNPMLFTKFGLCLAFKGQYDFFYHMCEVVFQSSQQGYFDINIFLSYTKTDFELRNHRAARFNRLAHSHLDEDGRFLLDWANYCRAEAQQKFATLLDLLLEACSITEFPAYTPNGHPQCLNRGKMNDAIRQYVIFDLAIHIAVERCRNNVIGGTSTNAWTM